MGGTIYLGNQVFPFAIRFIKNLRKNGKRVLFFINNTSHSPSFYLEKLPRLGFELTALTLLSILLTTSISLCSNRTQERGDAVLWETF